MQILIVAALLLIAESAIAAPAGPRSESVLVTAVTGGDRLTVAGIGSVRLLGISAPRMARRETPASRLAQQAHDRLSALVLRRWVRLERDGVPRGPSGWGAAYVFTEDDQFVNAVLLKEGLAQAAV